MDDVVTEQKYKEVFKKYMAQHPAPKNVSVYIPPEEWFMSRLVEILAIMNLLERKGLVSREEFVNEMTLILEGRTQTDGR